MMSCRREETNQGRREAHRTQNHDLWSGEADIYMID
jgi:hypothetical protein